MSGRTIALYVQVEDAHGNLTGFEPGSTPPEWAAAKITNPAAWVADPAPVASDPATPDPVAPDPADADEAKPARPRAKKTGE